jgi:tripartite-type tricarboxylate transporter receptor subunit TctC
MMELTSDPNAKKMLEFMFLQSATARAIFAPPGVPADRLAALRRAFDQTARDPSFIADMKKAQIEVNPTTGEETQAAVTRLIGTSPEVAAMVLEAVK